MAVMSRDSNSLELSEFFNNDDSDGYRLAEFLRKRRGGVQRQNFLFMNCEPLRLSLDVQLEKVPEKKKKDDDLAKQIEKQSVKSSAGKFVGQKGDDNGINGSALENRITPIHGDSGITDAPPLSCPATTENASISRPSSPVKILKSTSPRLSAAVRKSGGYSPGDHLRRYSLKRLSRLSSGRRALLQDFESTISNSDFAPNVYSTPLSQETTNDKEDVTKIDDENVVPNAAVEKVKSVTQGTLCCGHTATHQQTKLCDDQQLRNMVESIMETTLKISQSNGKKGHEKTNDSVGISPAREVGSLSSSRRIYTLEKGEQPGQVVLTPEVPLAIKINGDIQSRYSRHSRSSPKAVAKKISTLYRPSHILARTTSPNAAPSNFRESSPGDEDNSSRMNGHNISIDLVERSRCHSHILSPKTRLFSNANATPHVSESSSNITLRPRKDQCSHINNMKTPERDTANRSQITIRIESPRVTNNPICDNPENRTVNNTNLQDSHHRGITTDKSQCGGRVSPQTQTSRKSVVNEVEIPNTQQVNISLACAANDEEIVVPETQEAGVNVENSITIQTAAKVVVIPVNQTYNTTLCDATYKSNTPGVMDNETNDNYSFPRSKISKGVIAQQNKIDESSAMEHVDAATDNLKLTDIMTDDEEPNANAMTIPSTENSSHAPLNLAASNSNIRTKRLRKRSLSRRRLQMDRSQVMSTETETEQPPQAHKNEIVNRKRNSRKKLIPLNKAPGPPLNGEKFAIELARMSNYEILDLRKRNSMGRVFPVPRRKSPWSKGEAVKKQIQLDDEIELELLRRNRETTKEEAPQCMETTEVDAQLYPPVPDEFRDVLPINSDALSNSLIDEKLCDRVSFRTRKSRQMQKEVRKKNLPEVLQHYLEVSNRFSLKKKSFQMDRSKQRMLYTQGQSDSEENHLNSSIEKNALDKSAKQNLPYMPSPPRSDSENMPPLRVVSPPPPILEPLTDSQSTDFEPIEPYLPPPPQQFDSDSGFDSNRVTTDTTIQNQRDVLAPEVSTHTTEYVFKKPTLPPPKRRGRKAKTERNSGIVTSSDEQAASDDTTDTSESSTLRRSKRGHVPLKNSAPLFQLLFQQVINRGEKRRDKKIANDKIRLRESSKTTLGDNSSVSSGKTTSSHRRKGPLATVPENDALRSKGQTLKPKRNPKTKIDRVNYKDKNKQNAEALECSRIKMSEPPPLDHLNNVFDHLRNTSVEMTSENESHKPENYFKEKKLKVRVARLKESNVKSCLAENSEAVSLSPSNEIVMSVTGNNNSTPTDSSSVSSSGVSNHSKFELISWLKNITGAENTSRNDEIFKEMRISSASHLSFTELQGVEYAFYDTEDKASLGYLRFKPMQIKPKKRAKRYHLHFVTLVGNFRITANDKERQVGPGDMVAIEKSVYYDIENLSDDIGILMVIKK